MSVNCGYYQSRYWYDRFCSNINSQWLIFHGKLSSNNLDNRLGLKRRGRLIFISFLLFYFRLIDLGAVFTCICNILRYSLLVPLFFCYWHWFHITNTWFKLDIVLSTHYTYILHHSLTIIWTTRYSYIWTIRNSAHTTKLETLCVQYPQQHLIGIYLHCMNYNYLHKQVVHLHVVRALTFYITTYSHFNSISCWASVFTNIFSKRNKLLHCDFMLYCF